MIFSSLIFVWLFLPVVFLINYFIQPQYSNVLLLFASLFFYAWGEPCMVLLMLVSVGVNWRIGKTIERYPVYRRIILLIGIIFNLMILGYYKYAGFGVSIINVIAGKEIFAIPEISLPIGISFYTFQAISYIVDVYKGEIKAQGKLINTALYICFFPQLIAGPIVKYREINSQIENRVMTNDNIVIGFRRFIYGLSKKVLISNVLGKSADQIFAMNMDIIGGKMAWGASLLYTFQIYYDFSGYSDMAIGLSKMFGFDIPDNFDYPYLSRSISEFWRRWHISLGSWFKEYVYIPLGGNQKGSFRTYLHLALVFFLTGLWHGANYTFVVWGIYHGFFSILERVGFQKILAKNKILSHFYLLLVVNFGWVIFRIDSLIEGLKFVKRLLMPWAYSDYDISLWRYSNKMTWFVFGCAVVGGGGDSKCCTKKTQNNMEVFDFGVYIL